MPGRRNAGEVGDDTGHHGTQMALLDVELPHRVGNVDDLDLRRGDPGVRQGAGSRLPDEITDLQRLLGEVACEVALVTADDPDGLLRRHLGSSRCSGGSADTPGMGATPRRWCSSEASTALIIALPEGLRHPFTKGFDPASRPAGRPERRKPGQAHCFTLASRAAKPRWLPTGRGARARTPRKVSWFRSDPLPNSSRLQLELHRLTRPQGAPLIEADNLDFGDVPGHGADPQPTAADPDDDVVLTEPQPAGEGAELLGPLRVEAQHAAARLQPG